MISSKPNYVASLWVDLDGDGFEELIAADEDSQLIHLFGSKDSNPFAYLSSSATKYPITKNLSEYIILSGDVDGDGKKDIILVGKTSSGGYQLEVLMNTSTTANSPGLEGIVVVADRDIIDESGKLIPFSSSSLPFTLIDGNSDGKVELIIAETLSSGISIFNNLDILAETNRAAVYTNTYKTDQVLSIGIADFDGKDTNELFFFKGTSMDIFILEQDATILGYTIRPIASDLYKAYLKKFEGISKPVKMIIMDFDGDLQNELVIHDGPTGKLHIGTIDTSKSTFVDYGQTQFSTILKPTDKGFPTCLNPFETGASDKGFSGLIGCIGPETSILSFHRSPLPAITKNKTSSGSSGK